MPACGMLRNHDEKNTTYIIARFDSVLQGIWVQNYSAADGKVLLEMPRLGRAIRELPGSRCVLTCGRLYVCEFFFFIRNYVLLWFGVLLQRVLIQSAHADFIIPRGGGRRDREGFANPSLPLQHLSTLPGETAAAGHYR